MNQMRNRLHALGLVDRAVRLATDEELEAMIAALSEDQAEALHRLAGHDDDDDDDDDDDAGAADDAETGDDGNAGGEESSTADGDDDETSDDDAGHDHDHDHGPVTAADIRATTGRGRLNGQMESVAILLSDRALGDCIEQLGENSDHPNADQLREVLPGLVDRHGLAATRLMLASTVAGEANAAATIRDLLKHDELVKFPKEEGRRIVPALERTPETDDPERESLKARRAEIKRMKRDEAAARRLQSARDRRRV